MGPEERPRLPRTPIGVRYPVEGAAVHALPVDPYLGLTHAQARARAATEGRVLVVVDDIGRGRAVLITVRLRVELGPDGRVVRAGAG